MEFVKPALSIPEQIHLLKRRGMVFCDDSEAEHSLTHISYYRLRAYWYPFELPCVSPNDHVFAKDTYFNDIIKLYVFDRELRLLLMDAIECMEVSIRASWSQHLSSTYGPHGYLDDKLYSDFNKYCNDKNNLGKEIKRSKDTFITHYKNKYTIPCDPPIWVVSEVISLGLLSKWITNLKHRQDRQSISKKFSLDEKTFVSVIHHITHVRNICAHHGRLWNKRFTVTMKIPNYPASLKLVMNDEKIKNIYNTLCLFKYIMCLISPKTQWADRLKHLINNSNVDMLAMGFPHDWGDKDFWQ